MLRPLTCVSALVNLEVLRASEHFSTAGEGAGERLLSRVHADVVDELIFGLEGLALPRAVRPEAGVVSLLRSSHVLHGDVRHDLVHGRKHATARLTRLASAVRLGPQTAVLLLDWRTHVSEEGCTWTSVVHVVMVTLPSPSPCDP
jgi:hypothetical protein